MTIDLLANITRTLAPDADPDGPDTRAALLFAAEIAMTAAAAEPDDADHWTFAGLAVRESVDRLTEDLTDDLILSIEPSQLTLPGAAEAREPTRALVASLADFYASAALRETSQPWRRLAWASVAQHLDRAVQELS